MKKINDRNIKYELVDYLLKALTDKLMGKYSMSYDDALLAVLSSETYKKISVSGVLQNESPLYVLGILERELGLEAVN